MALRAVDQLVLEGQFAEARGMRRERKLRELAMRHGAARGT
jgi:hypothetical protein